MANVGTLTVDLLASIAQFQRDMGRAVATVEGGAKRMSSALGSVVKNFVGGFAAGLSVRAFVQIIDGAIEAADRLNDLSQVTGLSVETLGGLGFAAKKAGTDLEGVAKGVSRLNLQIGAARGGNEEAIKTFSALGLSLADIKNLSLEDVLVRIADQFAEWGDGANQAVIGNRLFKREYQSLIPLFNEGGSELRANIEYFRRYGGITTDVARQSDKFKDTIEKINLLNRAFATNIAVALLPMLDSLAERFATASEEGEGFKETAETIASVIRGLVASGVVVTAVFEGVGQSIGVAAAQLGEVLRGNFAIARQLGQDFEQENAARVARMKATLDAIMNPQAANAPAPRTRARRDAPTVPDESVDQTAKRILEGQIRALDNIIREESDLLKIRERFLSDYFRDDEIALAEFFNTRRALIADNLAKEVAIYEKQIELLRQRQRETTKPADREQLETQIGDVIARRSKAEREAAIESIESFREQEREARKFRDTIEGVGIELARMSGDTAAAAVAAFDVQHRELQKRINLEKQSGDEELRRQAQIADVVLRRLRDQVAAQAAVNEITTRFGQALDGLDIAHRRINLAREAGALSELQSLQAISNENAGIIAELREWEARLAEIVARTGDPEMILALQRVRLEIDTLAQNTDLVGDKFRNIFRDSFTDAFTSIIDGSKSAKEAILDFAKSVEKAITDIAVNNIADALFGWRKGGGGGNQGLFGGFIGDFFKSIFGGGFAAGGFPPVGRVSLVGEHGPELIAPRSPMQVIPNQALGGISVQNTFYLSGPADRRSQEQIAAAAYRGLTRAQRIL